MPYAGTRASRIAAGKCSTCGKQPPEEGFKNCNSCRKYQREWKQKYDIKPCRNCGVRTRKGRCISCAATRPSFVRQMTDVEAAWVGAMIEGEGTIIPGKNISCCNTDVETIATLLRLVGDGHVYPTNKGPLTKKQGWVWILAKKQARVALTLQIIPFLTGKRERAQEDVTLTRNNVDLQ